GEPALDKNGNPLINVAFIDEAEHRRKEEEGHVVVAADKQPILDEDSLAVAKQRILNAFLVNGKPAYQECKDSQFHYEVNCLEY
ncbi:hypothetical protein, partial [Vibrio vulnificus]|uniref:hypothetical protein n=1 Tax=Vibrio vulnificus TaxID=672 RepID=UPI0039B4D947